MSVEYQSDVFQIRFFPDRFFFTLGALFLKERPPEIFGTTPGFRFHLTDVYTCRAQQALFHFLPLHFLHSSAEVEPGSWDAPHSVGTTGVKQLRLAITPHTPQTASQLKTLSLIHKLPQLPPPHSSLFSSPLFFGCAGLGTTNRFLPGFPGSPASVSKGFCVRTPLLFGQSLVCIRCDLHPVKNPYYPYYVGLSDSGLCRIVGKARFFSAPQRNPFFLPKQLLSSGSKSIQVELNPLYQGFGFFPPHARGCPSLVGPKRTSVVLKLDLCQGLGCCLSEHCPAGCSFMWFRPVPVQANIRPTSFMYSRIVTLFHALTPRVLIVLCLLLKSALSFFPSIGRYPTGQPFLTESPLTMVSPDTVLSPFLFPSSPRTLIVLMFSPPFADWSVCRKFHP